MFTAPYPYLLLLLPTAVLARDDFRTRRVGVIWLVVLGVAAIAAAWSVQGWRTTVVHTLCNAILLLLSGAVLVGYFRLRRQTIGRSVGAGDAVFLSVVAPLFAPTAFLRFLIAACIIGLLWWIRYGCGHRTIPFVGAGGIALTCWVLLQFIRLWS